jgi:peptidyl serine alpha-galactosyltransferase
MLQQNKHKSNKQHQQQQQHHPVMIKTHRRLAIYVALLSIPCVLLAWTWRTNIRGIALLEKHQMQQQQRQQNELNQFHPPPLSHNNELSIIRKRKEEAEAEHRLPYDTKQQQQQQHQQPELSKPDSQPQQPQPQPQQNQRIETENETTKSKTTTTTTSSPPKFHFVFSTGCSIFQDWQSYVFFYHVLASGQENAHVTRIASGCNDDEAKILQQQHATEIQNTMSKNFFLHLTPDYSKLVPGDSYKFFNKPFGLRHWMEHVLGFPHHPNNNNNDDTVIVIFDPDQFLIRPFVQDFSNEPELWTKRLRTNTTTGAESSRKVERGKPMGARYAYGGSWIHQINITEILNHSISAPSPVRTWTADYVDDYFSVGPPYLAVGVDMYRIVTTWSDFVVPIYHQTKKGFMAEMYAYSTAAVHLNLPHTTSRSFMISDPNSGIWNEGWEWFDHLTSSEVCNRSIALVPHVIHYCQRYFLGPYFFSKYQLPKGSRDDQFLSCGHGLFHEPPPNVGDLYNSSVTLDWTFNELNPLQRTRMAFLLCQILPRLNDAATFFKDHHCSAAAGGGASTAAESAANYSKTFFFSKHPKKG